MNKDKVKIEVWGDVVCPFCYIGDKKLQQAISKLNAQDKVEIVEHSYQLNPNFPKAVSIPSTQYLAKKKQVPEEYILEMSQGLVNKGKAYGINFRFDKALSFNTLDAHRLIQWSKQFKKEIELKESFYTAYFTDGVDLSDKDNILNVVEKVGLEKNEAKKMLATSAFSQAVEEDIYHARLLGISGVPYFLINEKSPISGAQDDKVFEQALSLALSQIQFINQPDISGMCTIDGECN